MEAFHDAMLSALGQGKGAEYGPRGYAKAHPSTLSTNVKEDPFSVWTREGIGSSTPETGSHGLGENHTWLSSYDPQLEFMNKAAGTADNIMGLLAAGAMVPGLRRGQRDEEGRNSAGRLELPRRQTNPDPVKFLSEPPKQLNILDLFSGLKGWSKKATERGHNVYTADWDPKFGADFQGDIRDLKAKDIPFKPDAICSSPDCTEVARWNMKGMNPVLRERFARGEFGPPSQDLFKQVMRLVGETDPDSWIMENSHGSNQWIQPVVGSRFRDHLGPYYLWGNYPDLGDVPKFESGKSRIGSGPDQAAKRGEIAPEVAHSWLNAVERSYLPEGSNERTPFRAAMQKFLPGMQP